MKQLKLWFALGAIFVSITGTLSHFLYSWTGENFFVGLFSPVSESVWEHMKLLFFPMLLYCAFGAWIYRRQIRCIVSALCLGITAGTLLIPVFFYAYTFILGRNIFLLDIGTFVLSTVIAFRLAFQLAVSYRAKPYILLSCVMVGVLFACFLWFTNHPPDIGLFSAYAPSDFALPC